ncbi:MAG TPA: hypothetical protein EYP98_13070, partial [Planctomycetes bacterium]|nr:hypothetical protein [Planctomycetota bacterium]
MPADIAIFDRRTIGSAMKATEVKHDLPAGGERLYTAAHGIDYVIVNGALTRLKIKRKQPLWSQEGSYRGRISLRGS